MGELRGCALKHRALDDVIRHADPSQALKFYGTLRIYTQLLQVWEVLVKYMDNRVESLSCVTATGLIKPCTCRQLMKNTRDITFRVVRVNTLIQMKSFAWLILIKIGNTWRTRCPILVLQCYLSVWTWSKWIVLSSMPAFSVGSVWGKNPKSKQRVRYSQDQDQSRPPTDSSGNENLAFNRKKPCAG